MPPFTFESFEDAPVRAPKRAKVAEVAKAAADAPSPNGDDAPQPRPQEAAAGGPSRGAGAAPEWKRPVPRVWEKKDIVREGWTAPETVIVLRPNGRGKVEVRVTKLRSVFFPQETQGRLYNRRMTMMDVKHNAVSADDVSSGVHGPDDEVIRWFHCASEPRRLGGVQHEIHPRWQPLAGSRQ